MFACCDKIYAKFFSHKILSEGKCQTDQGRMISGTVPCAKFMEKMCLIFRNSDIELLLILKLFHYKD